MSQNRVELAYDSFQYVVTPITAIDRETLAAIQQCAAPSSGDTPCTAQMTAEVDFTSGRVNMVLIDVSEITVP